MIRLSTGIFLFFALPMVLIAIALKSITSLIVAGIVGGLGLLFFRVVARGDRLSSLRRVRLDEATLARLERLWRQHGPERVSITFHGYLSTQAEFKIWSASNREIEFWLSLGYLERVSDQELQAAFRQLDESALRRVREQNFREAIEFRFLRWKGSDLEFRHWFVSFWLYPLEHFLKIVRT